MIVREFSGGFAICADSTQQETVECVRELVGSVQLVVTDPPYGNVGKETWDRINVSAEEYAKEMIAWTRAWSGILDPGGAFYVWGGIGTENYRPFLRYVLMMDENDFGMHTVNWITWKKKRAYGLKYNYLFTREECAYFVKGDPKKPRTFHIPLLEEKRGYAGYNEKYPAKSEFYRRTNVWTDVTEVMQKKLHVAQKAQRVIEIPIEVHTDPLEYVVDPFAGCFTAARAAKALGRRFVMIEKDQDTFDEACEKLNVECS